ncbi:MAG: ribonuclease P protein component [Caldisericaceae bacterium]|nr:ribonuclease P protein component [Caldisericaceae bacterium]
MKLWERLKGQEFKDVTENSKKHFGHFVVVFVSDKIQGKVGFIASKKVGNAVERNRAKRLMRESFLKIEDKLLKDRSYVIVAKKSIATVKMQDVLIDLSGILRKECKE